MTAPSRRLAIAVLVPLLGLGLGACAEAPVSGAACSATHRSDAADHGVQALWNVKFYQWTSGTKLTPQKEQDAVMAEATRLWNQDVYKDGDRLSAADIATKAKANGLDEDWQNAWATGSDALCHNDRFSFVSTPITTPTTTAPKATPVSFTLPYQKRIYSLRTWNGAFSDTDLDRCTTQIIDPSMKLYTGSTVTVLAYACEYVYENTTRVYVYAFPNRTATTPADFNGETQAYPLTSIKMTATQAGAPVATFDGAPTGSWTTWSWDTDLSILDGAVTIEISSLAHASTATTG